VLSTEATQRVHRWCGTRAPGSTRLTVRSQHGGAAPGVHQLALVLALVLVLMLVLELMLVLASLVVVDRQCGTALRM
jgi:hypothetical protein